MGAIDHQLAEFRKRLATPEPPLLGPRRRTSAKAESELAASLAEFFAAERIPPAIQPLLRSAALLWHDHLDASHTISQDLSSREGSWLHGIMHRREPDYGNAKYWFRRVGQHEAFAALAERSAKQLGAGSALALRLIENGEWMPFAFVDECERAESSGDPALQRSLQDVQAAEFDVLVEHIFRRAT